MIFILYCSPLINTQVWNKKHNIHLLKLFKCYDKRETVDKGSDAKFKDNLTLIDLFQYLFSCAVTYAVGVICKCNCKIL